MIFSILSRTVSVFFAVCLMAGCVARSGWESYRQNLDSVNPSFGPLVGGTLLEFAGVGFVDGMEIFLGDARCGNVIVNSGVSASCVSGGRIDAEFVDVRLRWRDGGQAILSEGFEYRGPPRLDSISPVALSTFVSAPITLRGAHFDSESVVELGDELCPVISVAEDGDSLVCQAPSSDVPQSVAVRVGNSDGQSSVWVDGFRYEESAAGLPPHIIAVVPNVVATSTSSSIVIHGSDFNADASVLVDGAACTGVNVQNNGTLIQCSTPALGAAQNVDIVVIHSDGEKDTLVEGLEYRDGFVPMPPTLSVLNPGSLTAAGGAIVVTGTNFFAGAEVRIGGESCASLVVQSSVQIDCIAPPRAFGSSNLLVDAEIQNLDGFSAQLSNALNYQNAPVFGGTTEAARRFGGGEELHVQGEHFLSGITVDIDGSACTVSSVLPEEITCTTPALPAGVSSRDASIVLSNLDGQSVTAPDAIVLMDEGVFDHSFGTTSFNGHDSLGTLGELNKLETPRAMAFDSQGRIILAGYWSDVGDTDSRDVAVLRFLSDGTVDPSFGAETTPGDPKTRKFSHDFFGFRDEAWGVAVQADDKIVVSGYAVSATGSDLFVFRLNQDGSLDTSFGSSGFTQLSPDIHNQGFELALYPDDRILVGGTRGNFLVTALTTVQTTSGGDDNDFALTRLDADGDIDSGFGIGGWLLRDFGGVDVAHAMTLGGDGSIAVAGWGTAGDDDVVAVRYNSADVEDASQTIDMPGTAMAKALDMELSVAGEYVMTGAITRTVDAGCCSETMMIRFDSNFDLDTDCSDGMCFGGGSSGPGSADGFVWELNSGISNAGHTVVSLTDRRMLQMGRVGSSTGDIDYVMQMWSADSPGGSAVLDSGFGSGGKRIVEFGTSFDTCIAAEQLSDGRVVCAGIYYNGSAPDYAVWRLWF